MVMDKNAERRRAGIRRIVEIHQMIYKNGRQEEGRSGGG